MSKKNSKYSTLHKILACLEFIPVIGGLVGLIERIVAFSINYFSTTKSKTAKDFNSSPAMDFINCINEKLIKGITKLAFEEANEFLKRSGTLNIITQEKPDKHIILSKDLEVITGCHSGINRSQVAAAVIRQMGIRVKGVLAGGDSAMNPEADFPSIPDPLEIGEETYRSATNFQTAFGLNKIQQIGTKELLGNDDLTELKEFYQLYINKLAPTHFITFGPCGVSVLRRLLKRKGSLKGFIITHILWGDEIAHPPSGLHYSVKAYEAFASRLKDCFTTA